MNFTDYLRLNELKIFKSVRDGLPKGLTKSTNLLTIKDGVLYTWDFANNCVLTLNVKAARSREGDNVSHQNLLPVLPVLFQPEFLVANDSGTLLIVAGSSGVLVMELPARYPPYGAFEHNKDVVYCRTHSLDERLLLCSNVVKVRQVRFHPGSPKNHHILVLTSDNTLRFYSIENSTVLNLATYQIGETPVGVFPGTKTSYLAVFGEVGVDFDFGQPELDTETKSLFVKEKSFTNLVWPVYVLRGDGSVYTINVPLDPKVKTVASGPIPKNMAQEKLREEACSIVCINTNPELIIIANSNGTTYHSILLPIDEELKKELLCFESVELELGLSTTADDTSYTCPIFLHKDESKPGRYFATHPAGVHSVTITCLKDLQVYVGGTDDEVQMEDIFNQESKAEYLVCTKTSTSDKTNPVIGFSLYYEPSSFIAILANGNLLSLGILTTEILPKFEELLLQDNKLDVSSPLRTMLREPFDQFVQKILKRSSNQPILKLGGEGKHSQKECYELLQRAAQVFREYFENHTRAREEIEKRIKALQMMKEFQLKQLERMNAEKHDLQEKAESLAEKYEDIKDKQDEIMKRCEKMLILVSQKKAEPSEAEKKFLNELEQYMQKIEMYKQSIEKLKMKVKYQKIQMTNWKAQEEKKVSNLSEVHSATIKNNVKESSDKIAEMIKQVNDYKERLNLK